MGNIKDEVGWMEPKRGQLRRRGKVQEVLGLGGLVAAGLEIGVMFTMARSCADKMLHKIQPVLLAVFTFLQMHVLFLDSRRVISSLGCFRSIALMHLAAANVAVWVRLMAWGTARSWLGTSHLTYNSSLAWPPPSFNHTVHSIDQSGRHRIHFTSNCRWTDYSDGKDSNDFLSYHLCLKNSTLGGIWDQALPFLTPFVVQYSLGSAALLYTLWAGPVSRALRQLDRRYSPSRSGTLERKSLQSQPLKPKSKLDCRGSTKGLFLGILVLVVGAIVMILFFVLRSNSRLQQDMLFIVKTLHCSVLGVSALAILIGLLQVQQMCSTSYDQLPPHRILQSYGIISLMLFGAFTIVASVNDVRNKPNLVTLVDAALLIFQGCVQSLLVNRLAFKSCPSGCEHQKYRPGRQVVAFLIFTNFVLWILETFTSQNHVASQIQLDFFGKLPWDFITSLTLPIIMLYRIHSAVLFTEAWKHAYHT
ncbi:Otopetrin [Cordylochernes scorpioides]|uniref:Otopetrin n=1 Tax=Cordylochernes scorpioides TaxID=51811 RepID=A0ABY6L4E8_9ARAC|nr:Otopetrin [Cordylochernes scorpioides]